jgi:7-cyano-7-deazaguanine synthase
MCKDIPPTYVPARNTIFLSFGLSFAESIGAGKIFIGANAVDFSGYPDCRKPFITAFEDVIRKGTKAGAEGRRISIEAPLISMTKSEIISEAKRIGVPLGLTWSCYEGKDAPCGVCDSCVIRRRGFEGAGLKDPVYDDKRR